jgi:hypothetical protein
MDVTVRLHKPHLKQLAFRQSKAKRKVIVAGRRGGKTTGVADIAIEAMLAGHRVLEAAPVADQTTAFWECCKKALADPIATGLVYKNETDRLLRMGNAGQIRAKTAWDADSLRGDHADLLILDEYSLMNPNAWGEVGAPMLLDNNGDAIFIFTPKRKNHAFNLYQRAMQDTSGRWEAFHFTSMDNPYLSTEALSEITQDMTDDAYKQEILAEFLDSSGAVFRNLAACMHAPHDATPEGHKDHVLVAGVDWGKHVDFSAVSVCCKTCHVEVALDRFNQIDYAFQRARVEALQAKWQCQTMVVESNSIGEPIAEELQRAGLPVAMFQTTAISKPPLIESLALAFERAECQWIDDPIAKGELESYERKVAPMTGRSSYSAPQGLHDDTIIARALANHAMASPNMTELEILEVARAWR